MGDGYYLKGEARGKIARVAGRLYERGWSIREIGDLLSLSYPSVRRLLVVDAGVRLRGHGGSRRAP